MAAPPEVDRACAYDAWYETALGAAAHRIELRLIAELAAPERGERALDLGCGTGIYTVWLAKQGLEVTGLDRDSAMLAAARAEAPGARLAREMRARSPSELALAVTLFCFLDAAERRAAARELVRVVRPGGRVVVGELARYSLWAAQRRIKGWGGSTSWRSAHFTTAGELRRLFRDAGAAAITARYGLYLPPWGVPALVRRAGAIEHLGRPLGALGAAFVAVRAELA